MNFAWGKALVNFFLGILIVVSFLVPALDVIIMIFFIVSAIFLILISCMFTAEEKERVDTDLAQLEEYRETQRIEREASDAKKKREADAQV